MRRVDATETIQVDRVLMVYSDITRGIHRAFSQEKPASSR